MAKSYGLYGSVVVASFSYYYLPKRDHTKLKDLEPKRVLQVHAGIGMFWYNLDFNVIASL